MLFIGGRYDVSVFVRIGGIMMSHLDKELASLIRLAKIAILIFIILAFASGFIFAEIKNMLLNSLDFESTQQIENTDEGKTSQLLNLSKKLIETRKSTKKVELFGKWYNTKIHIYQKGEDYLAIGELYDIEYDMIRMANNNKPARSFSVGQNVYIPIMD